jgi:pilus assembly protein CpaB
MSSWKGFGLILFAAVLAVAAAGIAYIYLKARTADAGAEQVATLPVVVAAQDLTFGVRLEEKHLKVVKFPEAAVPYGAYAEPDSIVDQTTKVFLVAGEPVLASKLSSVGGGLSVKVPETMRASSVTVNEVSGVSGFVLPGDRVDVLCTITNAPGQASGVAVTKTIVQNIEVVAAGVKTNTDKKDPIRVQTVTMLVTPKQAEDLALGMHEGRIHLVLRNPVDHEIVAVTPTNTREVFGLATKKKTTTRRPRRTTVVKSKEEPPPPEPTYTIIRDGSIQTQKSPTEGGAGGSKP